MIVVNYYLVSCFTGGHVYLVYSGCTIGGTVVLEGDPYQFIVI